MARTIGAIVAISAVAVAFAQPAQPPKFEVASVTVHDGPLSSIADFSSSGARATWRAFNIKGLIMDAYNLRGDQVSFAATARYTYIES